ncbi:hypothetical protein TRVA0_038S00980 [Trichomonascus vanleenenianus]|uniref:uncharacterized protein n=1 Tax=Trichomonascus vanleenenianus TaxID=2268995 RepID=UPI003ECB9750
MWLSTNYEFAKWASSTWDKPPVPYVGGESFIAREHIAPSPTPLPDGWIIASKETKAERKAHSLIEQCLLHPPLPGSFGPLTLELHIVRSIEVGEMSGNQVVLVDVQSEQDCEPQGKQLVAKFYDPLYMNDNGGSLDRFRIVDNDYTHEVRAYQDLRELQGSLIPKFYGSFSVDIPIPSSAETREVRLILLEYIQGLTMKQFCPSRIPQEVRKQVMKKVIDIESSIYERDIFLSDLWPKNIIITEAQFPHEIHLVFVDFDQALVKRGICEGFKDPPDMHLGEYITPLIRCAKENYAWNFLDWIDWDWTPWVQSEYRDEEHLVRPELEHFS